MPIIEWADWQAAQADIAAANKQVSGMTPAEAKAALKFAETGTRNGSGLQVVNSQTAQASGSNVIQFPNSSASKAVGEYASAGGQTSAGGAATTGGNVVQSSNMTMTQKAGGVTGVAALLSVNLPTVAAAVAPIAGVAIGAGLYELNPSLWEKISRALLPFCYDNTELLPVVADEAGNTYMQKEAIDAVKNTLSDISTESGSIPEGSEINLPGAEQIAASLSPYPFNYSISNSFTLIGTVGPQGGDEFNSHLNYVADSPVHIFVGRWSPESYDERFDYYYTNLTIVMASETSYTYKRVYSNGVVSSPVSPAKKTINGKTFYFNDIGTNVRGHLTYSSVPEQYIDSKIAGSVSGWGSTIGYTMLYGSVEVFPQGVSKWGGVQYPINPEGIGVINRIDNSGVYTVSPYYPITMPVGEPGVSVNPTEVPDLTKNQEVAPAVNPWLTPAPNPTTYPNGVPESNPAQIPNNVPDTDPNLDPDANPSQAPEAQPQPQPDPAEKLPSDGGVTPNPQIPIIPVLPSGATGLLHVYNPTQSQIDAFGSWLWTTFSGDLIDTISKLFNDPMDAVIGLHELYATPSVSGSSTIRAGFLDSNVPSNLVGNRYTEINCGSIVVQEYYQNYLDYSPYTKCYIYLPFIGIVPVLADDIVGNAVNVTYHIDSYTGCCIAIVTVAREGYSSTVYQFEGNCAVEIPITSGYQSTLMGALIGIGATALTGNPHAGIAAANMGRASLGKNDVSHSGSFGSSYGAMGAKTPYIIVKRPTQKSVVNYNQDYGFPAHKRVTIGACSGYLRAREVHVISPTATDDEKAKIEELLKSGVFVK